MDAVVAISNDFFKCFAKLPRAQQGNVMNFVSRFQNDPRASGINYEKIRDARDPNMRSVRIDQKYRGIVLKPEQGNIFMLLWVDNHDDAYDWARRHKCNINPETGTLQIYAVSAVDAPEVEQQAQKVVEERAPTFEMLKDRELIRLGVPEEHISLVRTICDEGELDAVESNLPQEAYEGLFFILAGSSYDQVIADREAATEVEVDIDDFQAALERVGSQGVFVIVGDEIELQEMLNAPLQQWRVFLHPSQRKLAYGVKNGAVRVLGGAGTGKTVVAMHRAKWLAENLVPDGQKILFTTFTRNLAQDIEQNLKSICDAQALSKIEVVNLDQWVSRFLKRNNYDYVIAHNTNTYWDAAIGMAPVELNFPDSFYREEWGRVIQPQSITTVDQYKKASRVGRGTRLNRMQRLQVWSVFEEYRLLLEQEKKREVDDAYRDAATLLRNGAKSTGAYFSVIVDEAQDMGTQAFNLVRQIVPEGANDIFIVGDGHQRIYGRNKVVLSHCGINIRGRARKLKINYRTTDEIRKWAVNLLEGLAVDDLDGGEDDQQGYKSLLHGDLPRIENFETAEQQSGFIAQFLQERQRQDAALHDICIVARTKRERDDIGQRLKGLGVSVYLLEKEGADSEKQNHVRLATMHRVKGLEFEEMVLASLNKGLVPLGVALDSAGDPVERRQADLEERALLYVAITRSKRAALLLSCGMVSPYLG
ncbi:MAG: AAA family ATPase [Gammaproteobacteria bacterium]|jgi:superfamily I DNA/RNA helicase|nr:AAA family ATPase [Gammaproteobacteria bacterium]MBT3489911.1 AAA family ATPase [Gammaproteobacteria bacterium]MBT3719334.1 AAA family ATPase [Gammaproteobacteria bacterium]MBT3845975.1 AAA family ATPase [Gammaproteobacteria bacterium]MBT3892702.1 AAA family ATPase [Gammaproteobacteria bacterium]